MKQPWPIFQIFEWDANLVIVKIDFVVLDHQQVRCALKSLDPFFQNPALEGFSKPNTKILTMYCDKPRHLRVNTNSHESSMIHWKHVLLIT